MATSWEEVIIICICSVVNNATLDVINKLSVTNSDGGRTGIKEYPTGGDEDFWLI